MLHFHSALNSIVNQHCFEFISSFGEEPSAPFLDFRCFFFLFNKCDDGDRTLIFNLKKHKWCHIIEVYLVCPTFSKKPLRVVHTSVYMLSATFVLSIMIDTSSCLY